jgi:alkylhydroperoxidase family enzyme
MQSRISPQEPPYPASVQERLDRLTPPGAVPLLLFRVVARDERLASRFFGAGLLDPGHLTLREREIVILRTCARHGSEYEWGVHITYFAAKAKFTERQIEATVTGDAEDPSWSPREALLIRLADALAASTRVDASLWQSLRAEFSEAALLELLLLTGFYRTVSTLTNSLELALEDNAARFPRTPESKSQLRR